jgi:hypothetical protein
MCLIKAISFSGDRGISFDRDVIQDRIYQTFSLRTASTPKYYYLWTQGVALEGGSHQPFANPLQLGDRAISISGHQVSPVQLYCMNTKDFS